MDCPRCNTSVTTRSFGEISVPTCASCGGLFLHRGELNKIAEPTAGDLEFSTLHQDSLEHEDAYGATACPECRHETMKKVDFNIYTDIILDYCQRCGGFWLDGRELDRINEEVRALNVDSDEQDDPPMLWFARFIWTLPR